MFYNDVHALQDPRANRGIGLQKRRHRLCGYAKKKPVNHRLRRVKIIVIGEASSSETVPWSSCSGEEAAQVDLKIDTSDGPNGRCEFLFGRGSVP